MFEENFLENTSYFIMKPKLNLVRNTPLISSSLTLFYLTSCFMSLYLICCEQNGGKFEIYIDM